MRRDTSLIVRLAFATIRAAALLLPRRHRGSWRQEWEAEIRYEQQGLDAAGASLPDQLALLRRSSGAFADAAWLRRQFTGDAEMRHDLRHALRLLAARPAFSLVAIGILALGVGSAAAIFSVADALLLRQPPFPAPDRLVAVWQRDLEAGGAREDVAPANFLAWRERTTTLEGLASVEPWSLDYTGGGEPRALVGTLVSEGFFGLLGAAPLHGRLLVDADHQAGRDNVVVLDHATWQREFGGDPGIVGRALVLDAEPYTIVGVLQPSFELSMLGPERREFYIPKIFQEYERTTVSGWWSAIGRLKPGVSRETAQAEFDAIAAQLAAERPRTNTHVGAAVDSIDEHLKAPVRPALIAMLGAVALVLLIVCANIANLVLARGVERGREFAVRSALGAGRARLARQLLAESVLLGAAGTGAGLLLAWWLLGTIVANAPPAPGLEHAALDWRIVFAALALGLGTSAAFGLAPALHASRASAADALRDGRSAVGGARARRLRDGLAVAEIALAMVLVAGAGLALRSFVALVRADTGFTAKDVAVLQVFAYDRVNSTASARVSFFRETIDRMAALPGATGAGAVSAMPFIDANINIESPLTVEGRAVHADTAPTVFISAATEGYFDVMGVPLLRGRGFTRHDIASTERVALVSESLARRHWPGGDPIGAWVTVRFAGPPRRVKIVGVVGALRHDGYDAPPRDEVFLPHAQTGFGSMTYVIGTAGDAAGLIEPARRIVWEFDPQQTFYETSTVDALLDASIAPRRFALLLLGAFAIIAVVLAAAGVYAVVSFTTGLRTREIGVRLALGASPRAVAAGVIARALLMGGLGILIGTAGAYAASRAAAALLAGAGAFDAVTVLAVALLLLATTAAAAWVPARRAARVDPLVALRAD